MPRTRITVGCHPHNAKLFDAQAEAQLYRLLEDDRVTVLGEIGLDYHYDLSPREDQRRVFRRQLQMAQETGLPVSLHIREAHQEALEILLDEGLPKAGVLLHCCSLSPEEVAPWVEAGCMIAYGGALTFGTCQDARDGAATVPVERIVLETDAPYMAPVPLRGTTCQPDFVTFTMERMLQVRGLEDYGEQVAFMQQAFANAKAFIDRPPTDWQRAMKGKRAQEKQ